MLYLGHTLVKPTWAHWRVTHGSYVWEIALGNKFVKEVDNVTSPPSLPKPFLQFSHDVGFHHQLMHSL
jgi:hypothetical protein